LELDNFVQQGIRRNRGKAVGIGSDRNGLAYLPIAWPSLAWFRRLMLPRATGTRPYSVNTSNNSAAVSQKSPSLPLSAAAVATSGGNGFDVLLGHIVRPLRTGDERMASASAQCQANRLT
jgi:hypothetical protein